MPDMGSRGGRGGNGALMALFMTVCAARRRERLHGRINCCKEAVGRA